MAVTLTVSRRVSLVAQSRIDSCRHPCGRLLRLASERDRGFQLVDEAGAVSSHLLVHELARDITVGQRSTVFVRSTN